MTRHLGSSIYGWTSVIGVLLGGLSLGNFLGGKIADQFTSEKQASWLFLVASVLTLSILLLETPPNWLRRTAGSATRNSILSQADHPDQRLDACRAVDRCRSPGGPRVLLS